MEQLKDNLVHGLTKALHVSGDHVSPFGREQISLSIVYKKIPHTRRIIVVPLPHSLEPSTVCVFTKDACGSDFEKSADHYKRLAKKEKVPGDVTFVPLKELTVCYQAFESKRRLSSTFDMFLADRSIIHRLPTKLGKAFYAKRQFPMPVNMEATDLAKEIGAAIGSSQLVVRGRGSMESCQIGWMGMSIEQLSDNILAMMSAVVDKWPGGLDNIRSVYVNGAQTGASIYYSMSDYTGPALPRPSAPAEDTFQSDLAAVMADLPSPPPASAYQLVHTPAVIHTENTRRKLAGEKVHPIKKRVKSTAAKRNKQPSSSSTTSQKKPKKAIKRLDTAKKAPIVKKPLKKKKSVK